MENILKSRDSAGLRIITGTTTCSKNTNCINSKQYSYYWKLHWVYTLGNLI